MTQWMGGLANGCFVSCCLLAAAGRGGGRWVLGWLALCGRSIVRCPRSTRTCPSAVCITLFLCLLSVHVVLRLFPVESPEGTAKL